MFPPIYTYIYDIPIDDVHQNKVKIIEKIEYNVQYVNTNNLKVLEGMYVE